MPGNSAIHSEILINLDAICYCSLGCGGRIRIEQYGGVANTPLVTKGQTRRKTGTQSFRSKGAGLRQRGCRGSEDDLVTCAAAILAIRTASQLFAFLSR